MVYLLAPLSNLIEISTIIGILPATVEVMNIKGAKVDRRLVEAVLSPLSRMVEKEISHRWWKEL